MSKNNPEVNREVPKSIPGFLSNIYGVPIIYLILFSKLTPITGELFIL